MRTVYQSEHTGAAIDSAVKKALLRADLSTDEYQELVTQGTVDAGTVYRVYSDQHKRNLTAVYFGSERIVPRDDRGMLAVQDVTQGEYDAMKAAGTLHNGVFYRIYSQSGLLDALYDGYVLVARASKGGTPGFPYTFPIVF